MVARDGRLETGEEFEAAVERALEVVRDLPAHQAALVLESAAGCAVRGSRYGPRQSSPSGGACFLPLPFASFAWLPGALAWQGSRATCPLAACGSTANRS